MKLTKQTTFIALSVFVFLIMGGGVFYLAHSNHKLQATILESQTEAKDQIENLKTEIKNLKEEKTSNNAFTIADLMEGTSELNEKDQVNAGASTMKEEDLLGNFFAETPTLIENQAGESSTAQQLVVTPETFDLGQISKQGGVATAQFELKNEGERDLDITYTLSSCGCTTTPLPEDLVLKPGESYTLEANYDPNFYGPEYELGPIEKTITLISNDASQPFKKLKIIANVAP